MTTSSEALPDWHMGKAENEESKIGSSTQAIVSTPPGTSGAHEHSLGQGAFLILKGVQKVV